MAIFIFCPIWDLSPCTVASPHGCVNYTMSSNDNKKKNVKLIIFILITC